MIDSKRYDIEFGTTLIDISFPGYPMSHWLLNIPSFIFETRFTDISQLILDVTIIHTYQKAY